MPEIENEQTFDEMFEEASDDSKSDKELLEKDEAKEVEVEPKETDAGGDTDKDQLTEEEAKAMLASSTEDEGSTDEAGQEKAATGGTNAPNLEAKVTQLEEELKKERQKTGSWDGRIRAANEKVKVLEAENAQLKADVEKLNSASTDADKSSRDEVMQNFKDTFPELVDYMDIMKKDIAKQIPKPPAKEEPKEVEKTEISKPVEPEFDSNKHFNEIHGVHPDLAEAVNTGVLQTWINKQGDHIRSHLQNVYDGGSSQNVISLMTNFKKKTGWTSQLDTGKTKAKLESMIATNGQSPGPKTEGPDKSDFKGAAKEAGL